MRAIQQGDADAIEGLFAPIVVYLGTLQPGARARSAIAARVLAQQLMMAARLGQLRADARFDELIEAGSVRVEPIQASFPRGLPADLAPGDVVLRFAPAPAGRRALQLLAPEGRGTLVIRPGESPRIVGR